MLKIEKFVTASPEQWGIIIEGMRNPMNSWDKMDSDTCMDYGECGFTSGCRYGCYDIGNNDHSLMMRLANGGPTHAKYRRMIPVYVTLTAPLYWWKEFDTYKVGTVANSCSTMHKIQAKEFTLEDFSCEHLIQDWDCPDKKIGKVMDYTPMQRSLETINCLNVAREKYLVAVKTESETGLSAKDIWWQMIQLLPSSYNQKRTVMLNYEVLANIYESRKNHKLDEWHVFCDWISELPYSELIIGET